MLNQFSLNLGGNTTTSSGSSGILPPGVTNTFLFYNGATTGWSLPIGVSLVPPIGGATNLFLQSTGASWQWAAPIGLSLFPISGSTGQILTTDGVTIQWAYTPLSGSATVMFGYTLASNGQSWFNTSYNSWFDWTNGRWMPRVPDPRYGFLLYEEFAGTDRIGQLDWATGAGTISYTGATFSSQGVVQVRNGSSGTIANLRSGTTNYQLGAIDLYTEWGVIIPTLATGNTGTLDDYSAAVGLNDNGAYDPHSACTDGAYISLDRSVNNFKWICNTTNNTTNTATSTTGATVVAGQMYRLGIFASTTHANVQFSVNGASIAVNTTNIPTGSGRTTGLQMRVDKTWGTGNSDLQVDYVLVWGFYTGGTRP